MTLQAYIDEIKLRLTGGVLNLEVSDDVIAKAINSALVEVQRYIDTTKIITIPYKACIDMSQYDDVSSVSRVYRPKGYVIADSDIQSQMDPTYVDPMYLGMWQMMSGYGNTYNINDWVYNYSAWNTALQIRNTMSTDLAFIFDKSKNNLYINVAFDVPTKITVEYIPVYHDVSEVTSDYWIDIILRLSIALIKTILGRIRTKYTQTGALWNLDTSILAEGQAELDAIREQLRASTQLTYGID